jgi:hypothetical protein
MPCIPAPTEHAVPQYTRQDGGCVEASAGFIAALTAAEVLRGLTMGAERAGVAILPSR